MIKNHYLKLCCWAFMSLLLFSSCEKSELDEIPDSELPSNAYLDMARVWYENNSALAEKKKFDMELSELTVDWARYEFNVNSTGDTVIAIPITSKNDTFYREISLVMNEEGVPFGIIKEYLGNPFIENTIIHIYTGRGMLLETALYDHQTGTMRYIIDMPQKKKGLLARAWNKIACNGCSGNMNDGFEIEEVVVTGYQNNYNYDFSWLNNYNYNYYYTDNYNYPEIPSSPGGGGGGGGSSSNQNKGLKDDKLSNEDKKKLKETIEDAKKQNCAYKTLLEVMEKNGSISFVVDANRNVGGGGGTYFVNTKEIVYAGSFALGHVGLLTHEAFHAYQHQVVYGSGFGNYSMGKAGNINMEFEQIVFQDIAVRASGSTYGVGEMFRQDTKAGFESAKEGYLEWIDALTNNGTTYPNLQSYPNFDAEFSKHLNNFKQYGHPGYANTSEILNNLKPNALKKLFDGTLNCNN